jgi:hypothetical protein
MAAAYTWPTTLPQVPQRGFSETGGMNIIRTQTDTGPAKMRRRAASAATLSCSFLMTTAQVATFESFVSSSLGGVLRFYFTHPRKLTQIEVRIVPQGNSGDLYTLDYNAPGYWMVKLTLEILP